MNTYKKRYITVPKDTNSHQALDLNTVSDEQIIQLVLSNEEFSSLYKDNLFNLINEVGKALIDDYEDYTIDDIQSIEKVHITLRESLNNFKIENRPIINDIIILFKEAISRKTSVWFNF